MGINAKLNITIIAQTFINLSFMFVR